MILSMLARHTTAGAVTAAEEISLDSKIKKASARRSKGTFSSSRTKRGSGSIRCMTCGLMISNKGNLVDTLEGASNRILSFDTLRSVQDVSIINGK